MGLERINYTGKALVRLLAIGSKVTIGQDVYQSDLTKTYLQITLLNSFPVVNDNGMTLLPPLLAKASPTANNQPLNLDHQMAGNEPTYKGTDLVVGSMLKAYFAANGATDLLPEVSSPLKVISVLWNRVPEAQKILASIGQEEQEYGVSFEILYDMGESGWVVFGDDGPSYETEISASLFGSWQSGEFDKVALAVGGDGKGNSTHIWGGGFTLMPADENAGIDSVLMGSLQGNTAIATRVNKIETKEPVMTLLEKMKAALAKVNKVLAQSGFNVAVSGGDKLSLDLAGNQIDNPDDFYLSAYRRSDGTYSVSASLYLDKPGIDGFVQKVRLEYEPVAGSDTGDFALTEVEAATAKVKTPREMQAEIAALAEKVAGYDGYLSPTEVQVKVDAAVAAAKPADDTNTGDQTLTEEQVETRITESIAGAMAERDAIEASMKTRSETLVEAGFALTDERKQALAEFTADESGDKAFTAWIAGLKVEQAAMLKDLAGKGVDVTDSVKAAVACLNNRNESGYAALVAMNVAPEEAITFNPSLTHGIASSLDAEGGHARVM